MKGNLRQLLSTFLIAFIGGITVFVTEKVFTNKQLPYTLTEQAGINARTRFVANNYATDNLDFTLAAEKTVNAVVHVKTQYKQEGYDNPLYDFFFGQQGYSPAPILASGSGVIISPDGYVVTNNHVIDNSDQIEIVLNDKRSYPAKLIGADPTTDIALLKIDEKNLPFLTFGNSDELKIGEWVLAVGNPFNLTSTVTAGIVSAKARNIDILNRGRGANSIESFIQTDAAVNPGNSGGAMVNTKGDLVGINTAIASQTGSFTGYAFAIPVTIVKKVVSDLIEYGSVQRAMLGINIVDIDASKAKALKIDKIEGVFVDGVNANGAADKSGIKPGDIILAVQDVKISKVSELLEHISTYRPGDKISVLIKRDNKEINLKVVLQNIIGSTDIIRAESISSLGAKFENAANDELRQLGISHGVKIVELQAGKLLKAGIEKGFIITYINRRAIHSIDDIKKTLNDLKGGVYIEGVYPNGMTAYYAFGMNNQ